MQYFWGIDCSSSTIHLAVLKHTGEIKSFHKFVDATKDPDIRFNIICKQLSEFIKTYPALSAEDCFVMIENPVFLQNPRSSSLITHTIAGVKVILFQAAIKFWAVDNKSWKKGVLNNGGAGKDEIMRFSIMKWGDIFEEQDYADASCIALHGLNMFGKKK